MKMENYSIRDKLKAGHVTRWHIVDTVKTQSLAEHQWNVCMISIDLALSMGLDDEKLMHLMEYALTHDLEEIETGDIPSPIKERLRGSPSNVGGGIGGCIPTPMDAPDDGPPVRRDAIGIGASVVVRAADLIEAFWWASKYVLDEDVINDCEDRLTNFAKQQPYVLLYAINSVMEELIPPCG